MNSLKILHAADLHLDSPFEGLSAGKAAIRRKEQRQLLGALAALAVQEQVDLVLLSGDLLDRDKPYYETGEELLRSLRSIPVPVFIAPGNHDFYSPSSPYARLRFSENVHIFTENRIQFVTLPELNARVYGAAFNEPHSAGLLKGFHAKEEDGVLNLLCLHGELNGAAGEYDPVTEAEIAESGMDYVALGHIHKASGLKKIGDTWYSWPGCPEGRGFDETGEKTVSIVTLSEAGCELRPVCISSRSYEILSVDVTGSDPLLTVHSSLPDDTVRDVYRIFLTGETDTAPDLKRMHESLAELFFDLQLRDETKLRKDLWDSAGEDTLRGLFLRRLRKQYDKAAGPAERARIEQAARWGLAALDNAEEVVQHDDP